MDFAYDETQEAVKGLAKQILGDLVTDEALRGLERAGAWMHRGAWEALAKADLLALGIPEAQGGGGLGMMELGVLLHQVGRTAAPIPALETLVSAGMPIARYGSAAQRERWLSGVGAGARVLTAALEDTGSRDPLAPATRAVADGGGGWRLEGAKRAVPFADEASDVLIPASTEAGETLVFVVPRDAEGLAVAREVGTNDQPLGSLTLTGVRVEGGARLGGDGAGAEVLRHVVAHTRAGSAAISWGLAEAALFMTAKYSAERVQFAQPIGAFQAVKQRVADAYVDVQCMRVTTLQALYRLGQGANAEREVAIARFWACEGGHRVVAAAQHIHGGMGFDRDYPLYRYFLGMKALEFRGGGASEMVLEVAEGWKALEA
jgi:alkylation response protein AidB-like acyl-CoA dehydrogenase